MPFTLVEMGYTKCSVDVSVAGSRWNAGASPSLAHLIHQAALEVTHPTDPLRTLWDARQDVGPYTGPQDEAFVTTYKAEQLRKSTDTGIPPLGSGSDFTAFLQRLGVRSVRTACRSNLELTCSVFRLLAWTKGSDRHHGMHRITTTPSMTRSGGRRCTLIPASFAMCVLSDRYPGQRLIVL